jgi:hypothetical protein
MFLEVEVDVRVHKGVWLLGALLLVQVWLVRPLFHFLQCWHVSGLCVRLLIVYGL